MLARVGDSAEREPSERQGQSLGSFSKLQTRRREANGAGTDISNVSSSGVS
jgi:hypothetical protein